MVVMDVFTRRIIGFGVDRADLCGSSVCRMFNQVITGEAAFPRHLSSDHDPLFREKFTDNHVVTAVIREPQAPRHAG